MIELNTLFDAYINANILLVLALCLWFAVKYAMSRFRWNTAFETQLRLLNGAFLAILACPVAIGIYVILHKIGIMPERFSLNFADAVVAQYLQGNLNMKPSEFEAALGLRKTISAEFLSLNSTFSKIIAALVAAGAITLTIRTTQSLRRLRKIIKTSYPWRSTRRVNIRLSDRIHVPFSTRGLTKRYIIIPSAMLAQNADFKMALAHEFDHLRQSDIEWEIGLEAIKPLFFWNPAFQIWKRNVEHLRELACDQRVLSRKGYDPRAYGACLLRVCDNALKNDTSRSIAMPQVGLVSQERKGLGLMRQDFLKHRVMSMLSAQTPASSGQKIRWVMLPLAALIVFAGISIQKPGDWSHDRLMLSTIVNLERMDTINGLGVR